MNDFQSDIPFTPSNPLYPYRYVLPPSLMPDSIALWCVVDGDYVPFRISVHGKGDITNLKETIKAQKENALRGFDASSLVVWMVRIFHKLQVDVLLTHLAS
ncbi:hypothetical protein AX14_010429 [Amanita brunnescens Koide BX004]|nr:hypothetical protein AX14_010429 [Amanita brunnescens Koide BX004]